MVGAIGEQPPRLVQRLPRIPGTEQRRQGPEALGVEHHRLDRPLRLLGVDVGDVLAGVDRVHVPRLRRQSRARRPHRREEVPWQPHHEPRPHIPFRPFPVDLGAPPRRDVVVVPDRQHDVRRGGHFPQLTVLLVGLGQRLFQGLFALDVPARDVVVGHVGGDQPPPARRDPLELAGELHPGDVAGVPFRADVVERPARPRAGGEPGVGHQPGERRVVPEHVEHPGAARVAAEHVALVADAVRGVANGRFGVGQVGVRLVVHAPDQFDAPLAQHPAQVGTVIDEHVPVRLEVVDLGEHEPVVVVVAGRVEMRSDQVERGPHERRPELVRLRHVGQLLPQLGEATLCVPPDRVVVEMRHHPHGPAGRGRTDLAVGGDGARDRGDPVR